MNNKRYYIITIGCQMNKSDSERLAAYLEENSFVAAENRPKADLVVLTTCGVRESAENRIFGLIPQIRKENNGVKIVLTGCLSEREDIKKRAGGRVDIWMPIIELPKLMFLLKQADNNKTPPDETEEVLNCSNLAQNGTCHNNSIAHQNNLSSASYKNVMRGEKNLNAGSNIKKTKDVEVVGVEPPGHEVTSPAPHLATLTSNSLYHKSRSYLNIIPKYSSKFSAFIPIGNGCDNYCAYCVVPYARGREVYRPVEEILDEVRGLVNKGYKEINLIAQNVNSYNANLRINANQRIANSAKNAIGFSELLRMVNDVPGNSLMAPEDMFWIRFASSHPKDMSDELISAIAGCAKICEHIHLPAQAGDNEVLKNMNRGYIIEDYKKLIIKIRKAVPGIAVSTDIIVGFPGETREQFKNTVKLFEELKFDMAYIAQYSARPGTAAAKMKDDVSKKEKKRRDMELTEVLKKTALLNNKKYIGKTVEILVDGKSRKGEWKGKTRTNKNVEIGDLESGIGDLEGRFIKVKIDKVKDFGMSGVILDRN